MPISIHSKEVIESAAQPGITYTVRTLNKIQRAKRDLGIMPTRQELSRLIQEYEPLRVYQGLDPDGNKVGTDTRTPEQIERMRAIDVEYEWIENRDIKPAFLRAGVVSIDGLTIDEKPGTVDSLIELAGPDYDGLIDEMYAACKKASGLTPTEIKNSASVSTSTEPVETVSTGSSAISAAV